MYFVLKPLRSLDLNPIEKLWGVLARKMQSITNISVLMSFLLQFSGHVLMYHPTYFETLLIKCLKEYFMLLSDKEPQLIINVS